MRKEAPIINRTLWFTASTVVLLMASTSLAQTEGAAPPGAEGLVFKPEEIEQLVAPVALYPDSLVAQVLMASIYPIEIIYAERWLKANKNLQGDALAAALEKESWDDSVKALINFPDVITMMSEKLDWTQRLGDAFLAQQKEVMAAIQSLRGKAKAQGNLQTTEQQTVVIKEEAQTQVIVIESADPEVVYVPTYNPTVVYPANPPYYYYPPGYVAGAAISFGLGVACGAAWGHAWGNCNWGHGDIDIDHRSFNSTRIDNSRSASNVGNRNTTRQGSGGKWQHDPSHRKGANARPSRRLGSQQPFAGQPQQFSESWQLIGKSRRAYEGAGQSGQSARQQSSRGQASRSSPSSGGSRGSASGGGWRGGGGRGGRGPGYDLTSTRFE